MFFTRWLTILGGLFLCLCLRGTAQEFYFKQFSRDDGLPQSTIRDILQDQEGYIWLATDGGGVVRFDGHKMESFSIRNGLADNSVAAMCKDIQGNIWFAGSRRGLSMYDGTQFSRYDDSNGLNGIGKGIYTLLPRPDGKIWAGTGEGTIIEGNAKGKFTLLAISGITEQSAIRALYQAKDGKIWVGTEGMGCGFLTGNNANYSIVPGLQSDQVFSFAESPAGELWAGTGKGIAKWNGTAFSVPEIFKELSEDRITDIEWMRDGTMCISTYADGIYLFSANKLQHLTSSEGLSSNSVMALFNDSEGNLWLGTYRGGANLFYGQELSSINKKNGLCSDIIRAIGEDLTGQYWFATYQNGVCSYDGTNFKKYGVDEGMPSEMVQAIAISKSGYVYLGSLNGISVYNGSKIKPLKITGDLPDNFIRTLKFSPDGNLWVGTERQGAFKLVVNEANLTATIEATVGSGSLNIRDIISAPNRVNWLATSEGLFRYDKGKTIITTQKNGLPESRVNSVLRDHKGNIWAGTEGGGLVYIPSGNILQPDSFYIFNATNGMEEDNVLSLVQDRAHNLWVSTETGVQVLRLDDFLKDKTVNFIKFDRNNGFVGKENLRNSILCDSRGSIWMGTINGVCIFQEGVLDRQSLPPKMILNEIQLFREKVDLSKYSSQIDSATFLPVNMVLPYDINHLTFRFTGINFTNPARVEYRHRLVGFEDEWSKPASSNIATYSNLPAGYYTFELQAGASPKDWNREPIRFEFKIRPPWYERWWFYSICGFIVFGLIYGFVSYRTRSFKLFNAQLQVEIEQRKRTEVKLLDANRDLDTLLYRTAHDLKAPVATAMGMLDLALSEVKEEQMKTFLSLIKTSNSKLNQIVDNLLEITHIKSRKLAPAQVNLSELADKAWNSLAKEDEFGAMTFTNHALASFSLHTDPELLSFVFVNLFSNSIRYRDRSAGKSTLDFKIESQGEMLLISVTDNGIGIPENKQDKIFQMFFRGSDQSDGTGLGLYVVKESVLRLSGTISLESEPGKGTTFRIRIGNLPRS